MKDQETDDPGCSFLSTIFLLVVVAIPLFLILKIIHDAWQILRPDVLTRSLEMLGGLLILFGAGSLLIWLISMMPPSLPPWAEDDPFYRDTSKWYEKLLWGPIVLLFICLIAIGPLFITFYAIYNEIIKPRLKRKHIEQPTDT
jgi:hypothetical protein